MNSEAFGGSSGEPLALPDLLDEVSKNVRRDRLPEPEIVFQYSLPTVARIIVSQRLGESIGFGGESSNSKSLLPCLIMY